MASSLSNKLCCLGFRRLAIGWLLASAGYPSSACNRVPPPPPVVAPLIGEVHPNDANRDKIEDQLVERYQRASTLKTKAISPMEVAGADNQLTTLIEVELIFKSQITQEQLDAFLQLDGEITHVYRAISYGWNGRLPLGRLLEVPGAVGESLVLLEEAKVAQAHLDLATRAGRVRPIWNPGFAGNANGFAGETNITVAIIDSGMDASHPDLAGRGVFWGDYTTDASTAPEDYSQHATHIASIALGTGAGSGSAEGTLYGTLIGNLSGIFSGNFVTTAFDFPTNTISFTATAIWNGGGSSTLQLMSHSKGAKAGWGLDGTTVTGPSPLTLTTTVTGVPAKAYSPVLVSNGSMTDYAIRFQIPQYPGGDGFNRMRGVAPECKWAAAKVFANNGNSLLTWTAAALDDLVASRTTNQIKIINLSLGTAGSPGISTSTRQKVNTAVNNGILVVCSGGNDGLTAPAAARETDDPGRAAMALTVVAASDSNQLTDYSSQGFGSPSLVAGQEEDYKPDLMAPGGSSFQTAILAADSNSADRNAFPDQQTDDYWATQGTSFAAPFAAGAGALVIEALQQSGVIWDFNSAQHPILVKMLLCATASESNQNREGNLNNPTLQRAVAGTNGFPIGKDQYEGYGMINPDAAVEAVAQLLTAGTNSGALGPSATDRRVWARRVNLAAGENLAANLAVPAGGDYDLYLFGFTPGLFGQPLVLASSSLAGLGVNEILNYVSPTNAAAFLVVKRVSGAGAFELVIDGLPEAGGSLTVMPGVLNFGLFPPGVIAQASLLVSNAGPGLLTGNATLTGVEFAILGGTPFTLVGGGTTNLLLQFTSLVAGVFSNAVAIVTDGGNSTNSLVARALSAPQLANPGFDGTSFTFSFPTSAGFTYAVRFKAAMSDPEWQPWQTLSGDGTMKTIVVPAAGQPERYFQLRVE